MKRILLIILSVAVWFALGAYLVFAARMCTQTQEKTMLSGVDIRVLDENTARVVTSETVRGWLRSEGYDFSNIELSAVNTGEIKQLIESQPFVKRARVYSDMHGTLNIEVIQRRPILRINTYNGHNFYVSDDGWIMPVQPGSTVYVPIVTGTFVMPFNHGFGGSLSSIDDARAKVDRDAKRELYSRLHGVDQQRRELHNTEQPKIEKYRKQLRKANKKRDSDEKKRELELLQEQDRVRKGFFEDELKKLSQKRDNLYENNRQRLAQQKKEEQNYLYLLKLINFVELTSESTFWDAQIVQINVRGQGAAGGSAHWIEPDVELIPRIGKHIVILGTLDDAQEKLEKLRLFYQKVLDHEGWDAYSTINLKYKGQIVCRR